MEIQGGGSESEPTKIMMAVNESSIKGYPHALISSRGAFEWTISKIIRNNPNGFKLFFLHVQVPDEDEKQSRGASYSIEEDIGLCKAYIAVSEDSATGAQQKGKTFWKKIEVKFGELVPNVQNRNAHGLNNRWNNISSSVQKYVHYLSYFHRNAKSGEQTEADIARQARTEYCVHLRKAFTFDECYEVLKCIPKFNYLLLGTGGGQAGGEDETNDANLNSSPSQFPGFNASPSTQVGDSSSQPQSLDSVQRPPGQRKKKARHSGSASSSSVESILEETSGKLLAAMKERDVGREKEREEITKAVRLKEEELQLKLREESDRRVTMSLRQNEFMMKMREEDDRIMCVVITEDMEPETRSYWISRKQEVVARRTQRRH